MENNIFAKLITPCNHQPVQTSETGTNNCHQRDPYFTRNNSSEQELNQKSDFEKTKPRLPHQDWIIFDMRYVMSLDEFTSILDPLKPIQYTKDLYSN